MKRRAFTLFELLVVISIIIILAAIIVPAFGRIIESANYTGSINRLTGALGQARALAIQNGRHTGVAFFFDLETEVASLQVVELHGQQSGTIGVNGASPAMVFRPATGTVPVELPKGVAVFGMSFAVAPPNTRYDATNIRQWYAGEMIDDDGSLKQTPPLLSDDEIVPWLFPRNDPYVFMDRDVRTEEEFVEDSDAEAALRHGVTFMVQFDPSGALVTCTESGGECLIDAYLEYPEDPLDPNSSDDNAIDNEFFFDPEVGLQVDRAFPNEVILRSASMLAVVQTARLAEGVGVRQPWTIWSQDAEAPVISDRVVLDNDKLIQIWNWIDVNAEILSFDRYSGGVIRRR